ncbi:NAD(P)/FAD-dependent oxidoreductase [Paraburkholderia sp. ZP32-5]|uniref:NAD(P)/FAD-dependent oxidoreductase n=1 Tax=Paraburkholderia sp. ZP32-5 TaxID=2883245 RepID=UPI001F1F88E6|nr:FAD-dependent oxidoreductase [Paraburkholderia sp. ZP32-5]
MTDVLHSHIAVVGAGHAGGRIVQNLRSLGHRGKITLIGNEAHAPYERPPLSKAWLTEATVPSVTLEPASFWTEDALAASNIEFVNDAVVRLDVEKRVLHLQSGREVQFDQMVIATGGVPRNGEIPGADLAGVHVLRSINDSVMIREALSKSRGIAIIGAGVIGMEVASSALSMNASVTVIEGGPRILSRGMTPSLGKWLANKYEDRGARIETNVSVSGIERGVDGLVVRCQRNGGQSFEVAADTVLIAIGVDCNPAFLDGTGIGGATGVKVDECCRVDSMPWLFAAGDVAHVIHSSEKDSGGVRLETWRNAEKQAKTVARNLLGATEVYKETPWMWTDLLGYNIQVVGSLRDGADEVVRGLPDEGPASILLVRDGIVQGGVLINQGRERRFLEGLVESRKPVDRMKLADPAIALKSFV